MSERFFQDLAIRLPDFNLDVRLGVARGPNR